MNPIRTRFAPSPTGSLHIGSLRTALYNYLFAKQNKGSYILRIEDTDQSRMVPGSVEELITIMLTMGIAHDEGPYIKGDEESVIEVGDFGPYTQSKRLDIYREYADTLISTGKAYYSFKTSDELDDIRKELSKKHKALKRPDLNEEFTTEEIEKKINDKEPYVIRLALPSSGTVSYTDMIRGDMEFDYSSVDDQVLMKSDGFPTYHLASVVDDHLMQITHVIRGEEWLSSMPKHLFLYEALGYDRPDFAHLPLILNKDKSKLSKRQGDVAVEDFLEKGYLPETLINFVALLGWNPGEGSTDEIFTLGDLLERFNLTKVHKGGAVFDIEKLNWMNAHYLRELTGDKEFLGLVYHRMKSQLDKYDIGAEILADDKKLTLLLRLIKERIERLDQVDEFFSEQQWFDRPTPYEKEMLVWKKSDAAGAKVKLELVKSFFSPMSEADFTPENLETLTKKWIEGNEFKVGDVLWPLRVALTGQERSPNPFEVASIIGKGRTIERIGQALEKLS